jgi:hypothetical protein
MKNMTGKQIRTILFPPFAIDIRHLWLHSMSLIIFPKKCGIPRLLETAQDAFSSWHARALGDY